MPQDRAGSPYFVAAKRLLPISDCPPAGPSEVIIFADDSVDARLAALDILIECEQGADSGFWLPVQKHWPKGDRCLARISGGYVSGTPAYALAVLSGMNGGIVLAENEHQAYDFINEYAPEHCQMLSREATGICPLSKPHRKYCWANMQLDRWRII